MTDLQISIKTMFDVQKELYRMYLTTEPLIEKVRISKLIVKVDTVINTLLELEADINE